MFDALVFFCLLLDIFIEIGHILVALLILVELHLFPDVGLSDAGLVVGLLIDQYLVYVLVDIPAGYFESVLARR